jgi:hypothetical protein
MLASTMQEMQEYLLRWTQECEILPEDFQSEDKSQPLDALSKILEGLGYYLKLLQSAATLLAIDQTEILWEKTSVSSLLADLQNVFAGIYEAAESEDYSLVTDLTEYDLLPALHTAQQLLKVIQQRYTERVG